MQLDGFLRRHRSLFSFLQQGSDLLIIWLLLVLCAKVFSVPFDIKYTLAAITAGFIFSFFSKFSHLYASWRGESLFIEFSEVLKVWAFTVLLCLLLAYAFQMTEYYSRLATGFWGLCVPLTLMLVRTASRLFLRKIRMHGRNSKKVAIIGSGKLAKTLALSFVTKPWAGFQLLGFYDDKQLEPELIIGEQSFPLLGNLLAVNHDALAGNFDEIYITKPILDESIKVLVAAMSNTNVNVHYIPDIFVFNLMSARIRDFSGLPIISVFETPLDSFGQIVKRAQDLIVGGLILALIALPMLGIALAVRMTSKGPALFKQKRYGLDGEEICVWKFRSMTVQDNGKVINQAVKGDARITPLGAFLRRTSLDELPQFFNVMQGAMSIVGPRPHAVAHNEFYRHEIDGYMLRHKMKPGITGWAQVNGWRGETDTNEKMEKRVEFDLFYIRNWSVWLDMKIIFLTIFKGFVHENAY